MGFLDRVIDVVNRVGGPIAGLDDFTDPSFKRAEKVLRNGAPASAMVVGIERRVSDETTTNVLALQLTGGPRAGTQPLTDRMERLRLGMPVMVRCDGDRAVLDWAAMCARWGVEPGSSASRLKDPPADGVRDRAVAAQVQRRLDRWTPARAAIAGYERKLVLGMATESWHVRLALSGGGEAACADEVPFYAQWLAAPGVELPVVLDPEDPARAAIDWAAAANEHAARGGMLDDPPPPGSMAEAAEAQRVADRAAMDAPRVALPPTDVGAIEGVTLETWAAIEAGIPRDRVAPEDYDAYAQRHGVPAGRWSAIQAAWNARMMSDWRVGAAFGAAVDNAKKRR